jgi:YidC/Oxa1 family membrane protein insertase
MQDQTAQTSLQKQVQVVLPIIMTAVTAFQPAAIQLYFFATSVTGAITGYSLRQPAVRRALGIRQLPSAQSNALYSKIVKGEIPLSSVKGPDGKVRYQAPSAPASSKTAISGGGLRLKSAASLPAHMRAAPALDAPAEEPPKSSWEQLKATPPKIKGKISQWQDPRDPEVKKKQDAAARQKRDLKKYEEERRKGWSKSR